MIEVDTSTIYQVVQNNPLRVHGESYIDFMTTYYRLLDVEYHGKINCYINYNRYMMLGPEIRNNLECNVIDKLFFYIGQGVGQILNNLLWTRR